MRYFQTILILLMFNFIYGQVNPNYHYVNSYYRKDGTFVTGHYKTESNNTINDNYTTYPNINPHTGEAGTIKPQPNYSTSQQFYNDSYPTTKYYTPSTSNPIYKNKITTNTTYNKSNNSTNIYYENTKTTSSKEFYIKYYSKEDREILKILLCLNDFDIEFKGDYIGDYTISKIKDFQIENNLDADGKIGNQTLNSLLNSLNNSQNSVAIKYNNAYDDEILLDIEYSLNLNGIDVGRVDGFISNKSIEGIKKFQLIKNLKVDGMLGDETFTEIVYSLKESKLTKIIDYYPNNYTISEIKELERILHNLGYSIGSVDGKITLQSIIGIIEFQEKENLLTDGYIGTKTKKIIELKGVNFAIEFNSKLDSSIRLEIEKKLSEKGYYIDNIDGNINEVTIYSIKKFQFDKNLQIDGKIGEITQKLIYE